MKMVTVLMEGRYREGPEERCRKESGTNIQIEGSEAVVLREGGGGDDDVGWRGKSGGRKRFVIR